MLHDLTSGYVEGTHCPLAQRGHSRDGKQGTLQIVFGLLCTAEGCPVAVEVTSEEFPGERLIVCRNPLLAAEPQRKRQELLAATEKDLAPIAAATTRKNRPRRGAAEIGLRVGKVINRHKVAKHFVTTITDDTFTFRRDEERVATVQQLEGLYIVRSNVEPEQFDAAQTGTWKPGEKVPMKAMVACRYYKLEHGGTTIHEIDVVNMIRIVNGTDQLAEQRAAIGI